MICSFFIFFFNYTAPPRIYTYLHPLSLHDTLPISYLDPEKSTALTAGVIFEPIRNVSLTVDFWHIKVKDLIVGVTDTSAAEEAYYANNGVVNIPGITMITGQPDQAFTNALHVIGFIKSSLPNTNTTTASCSERSAGRSGGKECGSKW